MLLSKYCTCSNWHRPKAPVPLLRITTENPVRQKNTTALKNSQSNATDSLAIAVDCMQYGRNFFQTCSKKSTAVMANIYTAVTPQRILHIRTGNSQQSQQILLNLRGVAQHSRDSPYYATYENAVWHMRMLWVTRECPVRTQHFILLIILVGCRYVVSLESHMLHGRRSEDHCCRLETRKPQWHRYRFAMKRNNAAIERKRSQQTLTGHSRVTHGHHKLPNIFHFCCVLQQIFAEFYRNTVAIIIRKSGTAPLVWLVWIIS